MLKYVTGGKSSSYFAKDIPHHTSFCASWMGQSEVVCVLCVCFLMEICCSLVILIGALAVYNLREGVIVGEQ